MHSDTEIVAFYEKAFGPLQNADPTWRADMIAWCRKIIEAETLQEATRTMAAWASDGDISEARENAARLRHAAFPEDAPKKAPELPPDELLRRWLQATTRPAWMWWDSHHLPVYIEEGASWRRVFADGELIRAWTAAGRRISPDFSDPAVEGWGKACLTG